MTVTSPGPQSDTSGSAISPVTVSASDSGGETLSYSDGGTLPPGLSIDSSSGVISGTPTTAGSYPVTITATDTDGYNGSASFTWTITNAVTVTSPGPQSDTSGSAISPVTVSASDSGGETLSYSDGGTLPPGLSIDSSSGVISGTPTTAGSYPVTITATDTNGYNGSASFTWTITNAVTVTSPGPQSDTSGSAISPVTVSASDSGGKPSATPTAAPFRPASPSTARVVSFPERRPRLAPIR